MAMQRCEGSLIFYIVVVQCYINMSMLGLNNIPVYSLLAMKIRDQNTFFGKTVKNESTASLNVNNVKVENTLHTCAVSVTAGKSMTKKFVVVRE